MNTFSSSGTRPTALITGASTRVGQAIACEFARRGFDLVLTWHSTRSDATIERIREFDTQPHIQTCRVDMDEPDAVQGWAAKLAHELPRVDVVVHNASVYASTPIGTLDAETASRFWRVNALSPLLLSAALSTLLQKSACVGGGAIVCLCDVHAMGLPRRHYAAYSMSKAAIIEMVRSLAVELAPHVRVNGVAPGVVAWPEDGPESEHPMQQQYLSRVPLARAGTPEDAAKTVAWLACDATYITGQIIPLDGGRSLK